MQTSHYGLFILATMAPLAALWGCALWRPLYALVRGHATLGEVTAMKQQPGEAGDPAALYWHPIIEYRDECGATRRFVSRYGAPSRPMAVGSVVPVRFVPGHPRYAEITSLHGAGAEPFTYLAVRVPLVAGLGFMLFGLLQWSV